MRSQVRSAQKFETCIPLQRDNLALVESLGPVEVSVPARRNPFCSRRPVRDEMLHSLVRLIFPPAFGDVGDRNLRMKLESTDIYMHLQGQTCWIVVDTCSGARTSQETTASTPRWSTQTTTSQWWSQSESQKWQKYFGLYILFISRI